MGEESARLRRVCANPLRGLAVAVLVLRLLPLPLPLAEVALFGGVVVEGRGVARNGKLLVLLRGSIGRRC